MPGTALSGTQQLLCRQLSGPCPGDRAPSPGQTWPLAGIQGLQGTCPMLPSVPATGSLAALAQAQPSQGHALLPLPLAGKALLPLPLAGKALLPLPLAGKALLPHYLEAQQKSHPPRVPCPPHSSSKHHLTACTQP